MNIKLNNPICKILCGIVLAGIMFLLWLGVSSSPSAHAQEAIPYKPNNNYFTTNTITLSDKTTLEQYIINGPPTPPPGYDLERAPVELSESNQEKGSFSLVVPAYKWVFGCSAVSAAMIAGYYDRNGFPNIYKGPTNGGVMPLNSSYWPNWTDGYGVTYPQNPLIASHKGLDGRTVRGSLDDYWVKYLSSAQDPYITRGRNQHSWGDALGDYMKTSQSAFDIIDGGTMFSGSVDRLTCSDMEKGGISSWDGTYGMKLFYEARGYRVTDCYEQNTDNNWGGFTFDQYKAEIVAGRPVFINLEGHSVVGIGYTNSTKTIYIHDTWDFNTHSMIWGGSYSGMKLYSVSIVHIEQPFSHRIYLPLISHN